MAVALDLAELLPESSRNPAIKLRAQRQPYQRFAVTESFKAEPIERLRSWR